MKFIHKSRYFILILGILCLLSARKVKAQSTEIQQLLLNVEKLTQLKNILSDMKKGYLVVSKGYQSVKAITQGNFKLHEVFLDGLYLVKPEIRKYRRVADIIHNQEFIVKAYQQAWNQLKQDKSFSAEEMEYAGRIYHQLLKESLQNLNQLSLVITSSKLRMDDSERLQAIDRIFKESEEKLAFIHDYNDQLSLLARQKKAENTSLQHTENLLQTPQP